ncbi:MAG: AraC family transcriptional regulator [Clostridia bacterium]|nr:AraC family transcriptional regulator [Clostridia bacterium]
MKQVKPPLMTNINELPVHLFIIGGTDNQKLCNRPAGACQWHIFFTASGEGSFFTANSKHKLSTKTLMLIKPGEAHKYMPLSQKWETRWILFSGNNIDNLMSALGITETTAITVEDEGLLSKSFHSIFSICKNSYDAITVSHLLYSLLCEISKWHAKEKEVVLCDAVQRATDYMAWNYNKIITLNEIADFSHVSPQYLCRLFKKHFDMRPFEYLNKIRVQRAQEMLMTSNKKISEIASLCCFESPSYFTKTFKTHAGISPSEFSKYYKE